MDYIDSGISKEIESLKRNLFCQRDIVFFAAGVATTLFFGYVAPQLEYSTLTREVIVSLMTIGVVFGLWYWLDGILSEEWAKFAVATVRVDTRVKELIDQQYKAGYRDGVSAANNNSIDSELMDQR